MLWRNRTSVCEVGAVRLPILVFLIHYTLYNFRNTGKLVGWLDMRQNLLVFRLRIVFIE